MPILMLFTLTRKPSLPLVEIRQLVFLVYTPFHGITPILRNSNIFGVLDVLPKLPYVFAVINLEYMML